MRCLICESFVVLKGQTCSEQCYLHLLMLIEWEGGYLPMGMDRPLPLEKQPWLDSRENTMISWIEATTKGTDYEQEHDSPLGL